MTLATDGQAGTLPDRAAIAQAAIAAPPEARAVLQIDLGALKANWATLNAASGTAECAAVVKANAYGLGIEEVVAALSREGAKTFFVATLQEALRVRTVVPGAIIYVLDGFLAGAGDYYGGFNLRPVLSSLAEVEDWSALAGKRGRRHPAAIHIDTGMNRLGLTDAEVDRLAARPELLEPFYVALVMSHLACADEADHPLNRAQLGRFEALRGRLPARRASLANSGGIFLGPDYHFDLVRGGIAIYGGRAFVGAPNPMRTVVRLLARILQVREAAPGETVGYGASYHLTRRSRLATIACGYADGFLRALSGDDAHPGPVGFIGDHPVPVVGRVSMDLTTVDVTDVPEHLVHRGAWVEVMGERVTLDDLTDRAGTIGYELLTRLGSRVHRVYVGG
ncbi:MAG: alanine racemase [Hyphomicrobiaceae bacterium]